ncbi:MAG: hypothetical protein LBJ31_01705 [Treponema sp.]|jgi:hypothetical protein|nr:hypothetical protein [Treponema sp.]
MKNKLRLIVKLLLAVLILVSCNLPQAGGDGNLTVVLPGGDRNARSILSDTFTPTLRYVVTLTGPGDAIEREAAGGSVTLSVPAGTWTVTVNAYDGGTLVGTGTAVTTVVPGQPASVSIKMTVDSAYALSQTLFYIHNEADLRQYLSSYAGLGNALLENDITVNGAPAGDLAAGATLDGQGRTITLAINADDGFGNAGLLGVNNGTVKNLRLEGTVSVTYNTSVTISVGAAAGRNTGIIRNVSSRAAVTGIAAVSPGAMYTGGIAGYNRLTAAIIEDCSSGGAITGNSIGMAPMVGGITGYNDGSTINRCYAWGGVSADLPNASTGGIAGYTNSSGTITNCAALHSKIDNGGDIPFNPLGRIANGSFGIGTTNNYAYADMAVGYSGVAAPGVIGDNNGADITAALTSPGSSSWWTGTLNWSVALSKAAASETSPWYWSKTIAIEENPVNLGPVGPVYVPALWFE